MGAERERDCRRQLTEYYPVARLALATLVPVAALIVALAVLSRSLTMVQMALQLSIGVLAESFEVAGMRRAVAANAFSVTHGPGKFESFAALLRGVFYVPLALFTIFFAVRLLVRPLDVDYELALVALLVVLTRSLFSLWLKQRLMRRVDSPSGRLRAAYAFRRTATIGTMVVLACLTVGLALEDSGLLVIGERVDPIVAICAAVCVLPLGVNLCRRNFNALVDRPLPREERELALGAVRRRLGDWGGSWVMRSRAGGHERIVELEVGPVDGALVGELESVCDTVSDDLADELGDARFRAFVAAREDA